jgi:hypothetical protein
MNNTKEALPPTHRHLVLMLVWWLPVTAFFTFLAGSSLWADHRFAHEAVSTNGTVVDKRDTTATAPTGREKYYVKISYAAGNAGGTVEKEVDSTTYDDLKWNDPVPVLYLPSDPTNMRINLPGELGSTESSTQFACVCVGVLLLYGVIFWIRRLLQAARYRRAQREGIAG